MLDNKYNKYLIKHINDIKNYNINNNQIFINEPNINRRLNTILNNRSLFNTNNVIIISDIDMLDIIYILHLYQKKYIIIYDLNDIIKIFNTNINDLILIDFFIIENRKIVFNDIKKIIYFLKYCKLTYKKSNRYYIYNIFFFYLRKKLLSYENIIIYNINTFNLNSNIDVTSNKYITNLNSFKISIPVKYKLLYFMNDIKDIRKSFKINIIKSSFDNLLKFKLNNNIHIKTYKFIDILNYQYNINIIKKINLIDQFILNNDAENVKISQYLNITNYTTFNFIFNKMIPCYYYHDINNIKTLLYYLKYDNLKNDIIDNLFFDIYDIANITNYIKKNIHLKKVLNEYLSNEIQCINNVLNRFNNNVNTKMCSICYDENLNYLVVISCCQYIFCENCAIKATYKKQLQKYNVILGICPFCKTVIELENDLLLITSDIIHNIKQNKITYTNKKSIINIIRNIYNNKSPKYLYEISKENLLHRNINMRYIFSNIIKYNVKTFIITFNNDKILEHLSKKLDLYNIDYYTINNNINLIDLMNVHNPHKLYLTNLKNNIYKSFVENIINKYNKYNITNLVFIEPNKRYNMLLNNIVFTLKTYVNIHILNNN